ncbi:hypothetical protein EEL52_06745 [Muribaculaceae bacterium Isolate-113 (HZI)]|nr:hypothetical protein EEL52_06745 [Muribaculaceae bacterium Isolate-113 (HZI)]
MADSVLKKSRNPARRKAPLSLSSTAGRGTAGAPGGDAGRDTAGAPGGDAGRDTAGAPGGDAGRGTAGAPGGDAGRDTAGAPGGDAGRDTAGAPGTEEPAVPALSRTDALRGRRILFMPGVSSSERRRADVKSGGLSAASNMRQKGAV